MIKAFIFDWGRTLFNNDSNSLFPETKRVLDALSKQYILSIVSLATDGDFEKRLKVLKDNDLEKYFTSVIFTQNDKNKAYQETVEKLQVAPTELIIVDDRVLRGIAWGNQIGAKTVWVQNGKFADELPTIKTGEPAFTIHNIGEMLSLQLN